MHSLNVSWIVGPPYAVTLVDPPLGPLTGNSDVILSGIGFIDTSSIDIKFNCGKISLNVPGEYIDETKIKCKTPSFEHIGPKEAEIRMSLKGGDYTTTFVNYKYFMNTRAYKCLAYGPGLLENNCPDKETVFIIQARNDLNQNRISGRDQFEVLIYRETEEEEEKVEIEHTLTDMDDGTYEVRYQASEGTAVVEVWFIDEKNERSHIRGSPFRAAFKPKASAKNNELTGPTMTLFISSSLKDLETFIHDTNQGISGNKNIQDDVRALLKIKSHLENVENSVDARNLKLDELNEALSMYDKNGYPKENEIKKRQKLSESFVQLQRSAKQCSKEIAPAVS